MGLGFFGGFGTGWPASTEDSNDVGGSMAGCGAGAAKSRAAVPGCGPMKPSFTAVVLALSSGGSVEWGTDNEPVPVPRDVRSATLFRADETFVLNLSIHVWAIAARVRPSFGRYTRGRGSTLFLVEGRLPGVRSRTLEINANAPKLWSLGNDLTG